MQNRLKQCAVRDLALFGSFAGVKRGQQTQAVIGRRHVSPIETPARRGAPTVDVAGNGMRIREFGVDIVAGMRFPWEFAHGRTRAVLAVFAERKFATSSSPSSANIRAIPVVSRCCTDR